MYILLGTHIMLPGFRPNKRQFSENICSEDDLRSRISGAFFLAEIFEKVSFDPYHFRITRLSARKSEQMKIFRG